MLYGIDQPGCDITRAFLEVLYHAPTIGSPPHESGADGSNADLDKSDAGVGIIELRSRSHDDDGLAGFDGRKRFPDRCDDRPPRDRPSEFREVVDDLDELLTRFDEIAAECRALLRADAPFDPGASRVAPPSSPGGTVADSETVTAAWALVHAAEHLREHVAHAELTSQLFPGS